MKTVITKQIDEHEIVTGFDSAALDPEATKEKAKEQLMQDEDFKNLALSYQSKLKQKADEFIAYQNKCKTDPSFRTKAAYEVFLHSQEAIQSQIVNLAQQLKTARDAAFQANKTFFEPKKGEKIIDEKTQKSLLGSLKKLKSRQLLTLDGGSVDDNRGRVFYEYINGEWIPDKVQKLNESKPPNGIYEDETNETQKAEIADSKERQRVCALSDDAKLAEFNTLDKQALREAAIRMNELEISGELNPKDKSREWYDSEKQKLKDKYGITE